MKLLSIYSEPAGLFKEVHFRSGFNVIYGKKDSDGDPKKSLNGIGKSTLLDLVDFCLLSSFKKNHAKRLAAAQHILTGHKIILEVEHEGKTFYFKRSVDRPGLIEFGPKEKIEEFSVDYLKKVLANQFFPSKAYDGVFDERWFRNLVLFFLKIQKPQKEKFLDPIEYVPGCSVAELNPIHFFLLNLPNELTCDNFDLVTRLKEKRYARTEVVRIITDIFEIRNLDEISSELARFDREIHRLEKAIEAFRLLDNYSDAETEANKLTAQIKDILFENFNEKRTLAAYSESIQLEDTLDTKRIKRLYDQFNKLIGEKVEKTLDDAIKFRQDLSESRKSFLESEIVRISESIEVRITKIKSLEDERSKIYNFLADKGAIKDLTEAHSELSRKRDKKSELTGRLGLYDTLNLEITKLERESKDLEYKMRLFLNGLKDKTIPQLEDKFSRIYNAIYSDRRDESSFGIREAFRKDSKIEIMVKFPDMGSKGKNQGRTLVYDLLVVLNGIENKRGLPSFLVHDGIFDGMDKAHFIALFSFVQDLVESKKFDFQYIVTLNEEGTLTEKFGTNDSINSETIEKKAIAIYTPTKKLLGQDFSEL